MENYKKKLFSGCEKCGLTSPASRYRSAVNLPLALGCGPDSVCTPELGLSVLWKGWVGDFALTQLMLTPSLEKKKRLWSLTFHSLNRKKIVQKLLEIYIGYDHLYNGMLNHIEQLYAVPFTRFPKFPTANFTLDIYAHAKMFFHLILWNPVIIVVIPRFLNTMILKLPSYFIHLKSYCLIQITKFFYLPSMNFWGSPDIITLGPCVLG